MLKILRLAATEPSDSCLAQFLVWLAQFATLEELSLLLVASHPVFPLNAVLSHAHTVRRLVLDSRTEIQDPTTIIRYTISDLKQITENCPLLSALGISLHLVSAGPDGIRRGPRQTEALVNNVQNCSHKLVSSELIHCTESHQTGMPSPSASSQRTVSREA